MKTYGMTAKQRQTILLFANFLRDKVEMHLSDIKYDKAMEKMKDIDKDVAVRKPEISYFTTQHKPSIYQA